MIIKNYLKHPIKSTVSAFDQHGYLDHLSDKVYLKLIYRTKFGKKLNLKEPQTFNEKLQWLKLFDRNPLYTTMVDKYEVKKYIADRIGEEYIIPSYGVWDTFDEINFDTLPEQFVLKTTHDSGGVMVCKDKNNFDKEKAKAFFERHLKINYYYHGREWPYINVKPRILAESYMKDREYENLPVYKIMNFNGEPRIIQTIQNDKTTYESIDYFDIEWNILPFKQNFPNSERPFEKPKQLNEMLLYAKELSMGFKFLRTDFYIINGRVFFSEFTFFSDSGFAKFDPPVWDVTLGGWLNLL